MAPLILKLLLVPLLLAAVSVAGSRFGPRVAGVLTGLPLVGGPLALLLAIEQGARFGMGAAHATLASELSIGAFCVAYARACQRSGWAASLCVALLTFGASTAVWSAVLPPLWLLPLLALAAPPLVLRLTPRPTLRMPLPRLPKRELVLRMLAGALMVLAVTAAADALGPRLSGLITLFPIATSVLAVSAQRSAGPGHACQLLRGLALGLYSLTAFFTTLAFTLEPWGVARSFGVALLAALAAQAGTLFVLARRRGAPPGAARGERLP